MTYQPLPIQLFLHWYHPSNNQNDAYVLRHHQVEYTEIKLSILLGQRGRRAQLQKERYNWGWSVE